MVKEADFNTKGHWLCADTLTILTGEFKESTALFFYEICDISMAIHSMNLRLSCRKELNSHREKRMFPIGKLGTLVIPQSHSFQPKFLIQTLLEIEENAMTAAKCLRAPKCSIETGQREEWILSDASAGLESALRGLFTIKTFTTCFEKGLFELGNLNKSQFFLLLNSIYKEHKKRKLQSQTLEQFMKLLEETDNTPHQYVLTVLTECDSSMKGTSHSNFSQMHKLIVEQMKKNRSEKCEILHDCFSVLARRRGNYLCDTWEYSRMLDISIDRQIREMNNAIEISATAGNSGSIVDLETCIMHLFCNKPEQFPKKVPRIISPFCYIGSALIIRLFTPNDDESSETIICVRRELNSKKLGIVTISEFRLRAIVHYTKAQDNRSFKFERVENSGNSSHQLSVGKMEYLLFFERDVIEDKTSVIFNHGLQNLGNTCYMNASLNGLYSLDSFRTYFTASETTQQHPILRALNLFCTKHTKEEVSSEVLHQLTCVISKFNDGKQHCANQFTSSLFEKLDQIIESKPDFVETQSKESTIESCKPFTKMISVLCENLYICKSCLNTQQKFVTSLTINVPIPSRGETIGQTTIFCQDNFYPKGIATSYTGTMESKSEYISSFHLIMKKISNNKICGIQRTIDLSLCFEYMLRASLMPSDSLMLCDNCKVETRHYKQSFFRRLSKVLIIHFQRSNAYLGKRISIGFPLKLDMSEYCANDPRNYALHGVVYHMGSQHSGHYTACINVRERWYNMDDSSKPKEIEKPSFENAYMLFYEEEANTHR